jgi:hypothetical protein
VLECDDGAMGLEQAGKFVERHASKHDLEARTHRVRVVREEGALSDVAAHRVEHRDPACNAAEADEALMLEGIGKRLIVCQRIGVFQEALPLDTAERRERGWQRLRVRPRLQLPADEAGEGEHEGNDQGGETAEDLFPRHGGRIALTRLGLHSIHRAGCFASRDAVSPPLQR